jgi:protein-tyrosine phosphatase/arsenate reductase
MIPVIKSYCDNLVKNFDLIPEWRKNLLEKVSAYIVQKQKQNQPVNLVYICTHNSRRSHFGQVWAQVAADYYQVKKVNTFSGGTEATAFNPNAIQALRRVGFVIEQVTAGNNPVYYVFHDEGAKPNICFSKTYDDPRNPSGHFAAIMTCSDAEENCPFIPGVELRIGTTYDDPKLFDGTPLQDEKYDERCKQIALETFYIFSNVQV